MRGGQGIPNIDNFQRNGPVVASFPATMCDQFMPAPTKLSQSKPSQAKPSQAKPSQAKPRAVEKPPRAVSRHSPLRNL